jgi:ribonuclease-3
LGDNGLGLEQLQESLGLRFRASGLLLEALTHASFVHESGDPTLADNQRLEFLGDAIVACVVADWLYHRFPQAREGELTSLRAYLVRTESLAAIAEEVGLGGYLRIGRGEAAAGGRSRRATLCAALEALVAAVYLDRGIASVTSWLQDLFAGRLQAIEAQWQVKDAKSLLQEYTQASLHVTPVYQIIDQVGPDHALRFTAQVLIDGQVWGEGTGNSKQVAQQAAAERACARVAGVWHE